MGFPKCVANVVPYVAQFRGFRLLFVRRTLTLTGFLDLAFHQADSETFLRRNCAL